MKHVKILTALLALTLLATTVTAAPSITTTISKTDPIQLEPGTRATLFLAVQNVGSDPARDVEVRFEGYEGIRLLNPTQQTQSLNVIGTQQDYVIELDVYLEQSLPLGTHNLPFTVTAENLPGVELRPTPQIVVGANQASVTIESVETAPERLEPGMQGAIYADLTNTGSRSIRNIDVSYDSTSTPLKPLGDTNVKRIPVLEPRSTQTLNYQVIASPDAMSGVYEVPFTVTYTDQDGTQTQSTYQSTTILDAPVKLDISISESTLTQNRPRGTATLNVVNNGLTDLKLVSAAVLSRGNTTVQGTDSFYIGELESDDFDVFTINAETTSDTFQVPINITYTTPFNTEGSRVVTAEYPLPAETQSSSNTTVYVVAGILLVAAIYWYRRR